MLVRRGEPVVSIVYDPAMKDAFVATKGDGATCNRLPIRVSPKSDLRTTVAGTAVPPLGQVTGRFTGVFQGVQGKGQPVDFIATDILRVRDGRITDNWHLEDNLTFLKQIGSIP